MTIFNIGLLLYIRNHFHKVFVDVQDNNNVFHVSTNPKADYVGDRVRVYIDDDTVFYCYSNEDLRYVIMRKGCYNEKFIS